MTEAARRNLAKPHTIEVRTRAKAVKAAKDALSRFVSILGERSEAIRALNTRKPMARVRAAGYEGAGRVMLEAASNLQRAGDEDAAWAKGLKDVEQHAAALQRSILRLEAIAARQYAEACDGADEDDEYEDEDDE